MTSPPSLTQYSVAVIAQTNPVRKIALAREIAAKWQSLTICPPHPSCEAKIPDQPGRPEKLQLLSPRKMPRRRSGSKKGLIALVHALAHIELNAIDMSFDLIARFCEAPLPRAFLEGALKVALEEVQHFESINAHLEELGAEYGDLPAHGGLWDATKNTGHDLLARLAIVPLVLEARGLDVSPSMIAQVKGAGEEAIAQTMTSIYKDEITHVAFGARWFKTICSERGIDPPTTFQSLVRDHYQGMIKPPFNQQARSSAGLTPDFYLPLVRT